MNVIEISIFLSLFDDYRRFMKESSKIAFFLINVHTKIIKYEQTEMHENTFQDLRDSD